MDALSQAAAEITAELPAGSVDVRLRGPRARDSWSTYPGCRRPPRRRPARPRPARTLTRPRTTRSPGGHAAAPRVGEVQGRGARHQGRSLAQQLDRQRRPHRDPGPSVHSSRRRPVQHPLRRGRRVLPRPRLQADDRLDLSRPAPPTSPTGARRPGGRAHPRPQERRAPCRGPSRPPPRSPCTSEIGSGDVRVEAADVDTTDVEVTGHGEEHVRVEQRDDVVA